MGVYRVPYRIYPVVAVTLVSLTDIFTSWLGVLGGISGLAVLAYMALIVHFTRKRDRDVQELRREVAEIKGLLLGTARGGKR